MPCRFSFEDRARWSKSPATILEQQEVWLPLLFCKDFKEKWDLLIAGEEHAPRRTTPPSYTGAELGQGTRSLNLAINIVAGGFGIKAAGRLVAPGCADTGVGLSIPTTAMSYDFGALARCVAKLKYAAPEFAEETRATITASAGVEFATVAAVMDAIRGHDGAELFPDVRFGIAR